MTDNMTNNSHTITTQRNQWKIKKKSCFYMIEYYRSNVNKEKKRRYVRSIGIKAFALEPDQWHK